MLKLHIQIPAEDLQEFNRNNDSLSIKWLPGTKALYTSYSHCLNDAFRKKKKSFALYGLYSPQAFLFILPFSCLQEKETALKVRVSQF